MMRAHKGRSCVVLHHVRWLALLIWFGASTGASAQTEEILIEYGFAEGISESLLNQIYSDSRGTIWLCGEEAVYRFMDGVFRPESEINSAIDGSIESICELDDGSIQIHTSQGQIIYDGLGMALKSSSARACSQGASTVSGVSLEVNCVEYGNLGVLLAGTDQGLYVIDEVSPEPALLSQDPRLKDTILSLAFDKENALWILTASHGLMRRQVVDKNPCLQGNWRSPAVSVDGQSVAAIDQSSNLAVWRPGGNVTNINCGASTTPHDLAFLQTGEIIFLDIGGRLHKVVGDTSIVLADLADTDSDMRDIKIFNSGSGEAFIFKKGLIYQLELQGEQARFYLLGERSRMPAFVGLNFGGKLFTVTGNEIEISRARQSRNTIVLNDEVTAVESMEGLLILGLKSGDISLYDGVRQRQLYQHSQPGTEKVLSIEAIRGIMHMATDQGIYQAAFDDSELTMHSRRRVQSFGRLRLNVDQVALGAGLVVVCESNRICVSHLQGFVLNNREPYVQLTDVRLADGAISTSKHRSDIGPFYQQREATVLRHAENSIGFVWRTGSLVNSPVLYQFRLDTLSSWSELQSTPFTEFNSLNPGSYEFQVRGCTVDGRCSDSISWSFVIRTPWWQRWYMWLGVSAIVCVLMWLGFKMRIRQVKRSSARELELMNTRLQASEFRQKMLQLQMNPHFISNVMQTIQNKIERGDTSGSGKDLTAFSKLMRTMLMMSRKELVSLEDELDFLTNYVQIENMYRDDSIHLNIDLDESVEPFGEMLPVMMLQPVIENAINHGGPNIEVHIGKRGRFLDIAISDNGPGFGQGSMESDKSIALKVLRERIARIKGASIRFSNKPEGGALVELSLKA